ncbi:DUF1841 family protein [Legionella sp. km535]|uniref:DUF1841 family protein n=1 Tax=Legionella sp. km535 TaxID=2498107 RepID=UPI000F8F4225|nr:DUF1841 family protein [Legionella sp. km535]RUR20534.1 DUF1841 family protein [Legionella sp. km535]
MLYGDTIQDTRQMFFSSWNKYQQKQLLSPLENEIVQVILVHPEYHKILEQSSKFQEQAYYPELGETNPFLHMGLHLAVREQISTDRPAGIRAVYHALVKKYKDTLAVEHLIMEQLAECLWSSQKNNMPPDEQHYLNALSGYIDDNQLR